ncbi:BPSS1780 family membrane protein [Thiorhodovibrio frisius]|uniref:Putative integral membrane protein n=1 Tax=Thiorhodovibrio frisius TaxID=631362 RepID=H8YZB4_9GAMM|nr:BPSS1780 family membrane protein [Thiorhodovibrio frisius]EIC22041.1 putative integral membrane protein [Thiorhodovibrio frisius]WPL24332.1 putative integral membrane protein [Thiorhodovibrio frisius]
MSKLCTVVFTGQLQPGSDPEQAAKKFASVFKVPEDKARRLIRDGQEKALKKDVDPAAAAHYREILDEIGLITRIDTGAGSGTPSLGKGCPKCGSSRVENGVCKSCGVLVDAYLANQTAERKAQSAPLGSPSTGPSAPPPHPGSSPGTAPPLPGYRAGMTSGQPPEPESVPMGHGLGWIGAGWALFKQAPLAWIGALVLLLLINLALAFVPLIGSIASVLIGPVLIGGLMAGAHEQASGGQFRVNHLFEGFSKNTASLIGVGGLYMLGSIILTILTILMVVILVNSAMPGGMGVQALDANPELLLQALDANLVLLFLLIMALLVPLMMAYWFAPALVMLKGLGAVAAMKLSFLGCLKNVLPFLIYGLVSAVLMVLALIPFGLGLLILSPILIASMYAAYRDIFQTTR